MSRNAEESRVFAYNEADDVMSMALPPPLVFTSLSPAEKDRLFRVLLPWLATFEMVATTGNRRRIGDKLGKTPAGVGKAIPHIESILAPYVGEGVRLIDPAHPRNPHRTEYGEVALRFSQGVNQLLEWFLSEVGRIRNDPAITVATAEAGWLTYGPQLESLYKQRVENGSVTVRFFGDHEVEAELLAGRADIGIVSYPPRRVAPPLRLHPLRDQEMLLVLPARDPQLPPRGKPVTLREVTSGGDVRLGFISYSSRHTDMPANKVLGYLRQQGLRYLIDGRIEADNIADIKHKLANTRNRMSILPAFAVKKEVESGLFRAYRLDPPIEPWPWGVIARSYIARPAVADFMAGFETLKLMKQEL